MGGGLGGVGGRGREGAGKGGWACRAQAETVNSLHLYIQLGGLFLRKGGECREILILFLFFYYSPDFAILSNIDTGEISLLHAKNQKQV